MSSRIRRASTTLLALLIATSSLAQTNDQANADDLLGKAQQSVGFVVAAAKGDPVLKVDTGKSMPFWNG